MDRLDLVNAALSKLGLPVVMTKSNVTKMPAADVKLLSEYLQVNVDHDAVTGEDLDFTEDYVKTGGLFKHSKTGNATAADLKDGLRRFLSK